MWKLLHQFRQDGWNFRRQVEIGTYYADFACRHPSIVIEVDGESHRTDMAQANDATRDEYFRSRGYLVLRFWNNEVVSNPEGVFSSIATMLASYPPPRGEGSAASASSARSKARVRGEASTVSPMGSSLASPPTPSFPARGRGASHQHRGVS